MTAERAASTETWSRSQLEEALKHLDDLHVQVRFKVTCTRILECGPLDGPARFTQTSMFRDSAQLSDMNIGGIASGSQIDDTTDDEDFSNTLCVPYVTMSPLLPCGSCIYQATLNHSLYRISFYAVNVLHLASISALPHDD